MRSFTKQLSVMVCSIAVCGAAVYANSSAIGRRAVALAKTTSPQVGWPLSKMLNPPPYGLLAAAPQEGGLLDHMMPHGRPAVSGEIWAVRISDADGEISASQITDADGEISAGRITDADGEIWAVRISDADGEISASQITDIVASQITDILAQEIGPYGEQLFTRKDAEIVASRITDILAQEIGPYGEIVASQITDTVASQITDADVELLASQLTDILAQEIGPYGEQLFTRKDAEIVASRITDIFNKQPIEKRPIDDEQSRTRKDAAMITDILAQEIGPYGGQSHTGEDRGLLLHAHGVPAGLNP